MMHYITSSRRVQLVLLLIFTLLISCQKNLESEPEKASSDVAFSFDEAYRSQYHFTPPTHWMNDPNGLVYVDGVYHLFYQYYPEDIVWGPMHWGHAISTDLIRWEHKPIALFPDEHGLIFSGSAVIDEKNSSGFGSIENPPMVAVFTYHLMEGEQSGRKDFQTQGIAYSLDQGETWVKYGDNPVIGNEGIKDFRDPKVFWHQESNKWIMVLVAGDHAKFYSSPDLINWNHLSDFGKDKGAHGGVWECPDLFKMKIEGSDVEKWVLLVSINPGAPNGGSGTQYFVGEFNGEEFTTAQSEDKWLDLGRDNYAGVTYNNTPSDRRIFIGWMSNWDYARSTPTEVWRSAMTLPRELSLHLDETSFRVHSKPVEEVGTLQKNGMEIKSIDLDQDRSFDLDGLQQSKLRFEFRADQPLSFSVGNSKDSLYIEYDPVQLILSVDRSQSGEVDFDPSFVIGKQVYPIGKDGQTRVLELYLDRSSVELFLDNGRYVMTNQIFPRQPFNQIHFNQQQGQQVSSITFSPLKSIWKDE